MALQKIQEFIKKMSETPKVKKVLSDIQNLTVDVQKRVQHLNKTEAVKKYKNIAKKVSKAESDLQKEVTQVVKQIRTATNQAEKNLDSYKKIALQQKAKIEKIIKNKRAEFSVSATLKPNLKPKTKKAAAKKPTAKAAAKPVRKKAAKKKSA